MIATHKKTVKMNFSTLYSYVLNTNYRSFPGVTSLIFSIFATVVLVVKWDEMASNYRALFIFAALLFTVINPLSLAFKTFKQLKLSPSYKLPLDYEFSDKGITVSQGENSQDIEWKHICRIMMTEKMLAIYTGRLNAFVIPLKELGDERGKIIASVVQFTAEYRPQLSKSLKRYQSGKGI